jgi:hypothetical protein
MTGKRADVLLNTMMVIEMYSLKRALTDLSQDEFDWTPHQGAWGVHPRSACTTPDPLGAADGDWVVDNDWTIVEGAYQDWLAEKPVRDRRLEPMPTIGWLLNHFGAAPGLMAELEIVGGPNTPTPERYQAMWNTTIIHTADDAVQRIRDGWAALDAALRRTADDVLERDFEGHPWRRGDLAITAMLNEVSHHATQVCVLRDLYHHAAR